MNEIYYFNNNAGGLNQFYTQQEVEKFRNGSDPLNYPNTDYRIEKNSSSDKTQHFHKRGTNDIKYFVSMGALFQDGIHKTE